MEKKSIPVPTVQPGSSEADLNQFIRGFLEILVNRNIVVSIKSYAKKNIQAEKVGNIISDEQCITCYYCRFSVV